jgi:hypothetical protein
LRIVIPPLISFIVSEALLNRRASRPASARAGRSRLGPETMLGVLSS